MFTDTVGSTAAAQADEAAALRRWQEQEELLRPLLAAFGGREIKETGDGFLVEFGSALKATQCAVEIQRRLRERNSQPERVPIVLRIGIHLGDVEEHGPDIFGDAVNIAARVEPLAEPGGICISAQVFDQVRDKLPDPMEKLAEIQLKGVLLPRDVYRIVLPWKPTAPPQKEPERTRLAVLPFANMSPDPQDAYFADGLTEELITELSRIPGLRVIARTSVMRYKSSPKGISEISRELGVGTALEGGVRKSGRRIRITAQLVDARTEEHLWAERFDRDLDDIFTVQTDVASKVAGALARGVLSEVPRKETRDMEAYTSYLRALRSYHDGTPASLREGLRLFEAATERDPGFARAHAGLAMACVALVDAGAEDVALVSRRAEPAALRALELAPDSAEAHAARSQVHGYLDRFSEALAEGERAIEINPNFAEGYENLGKLRTAVVSLDTGLDAYRRAHELDPLSVRIGINLAWVAQLAGREEEAREVLATLVRLHPGEQRVGAAQAEFYCLKGDLVRAEEVVRDYLRSSPHSAYLRAKLAEVCALGGRRHEAEEALRGAEAEEGSASGKTYMQAFIFAALGDADRAFATLDRLAESHAWPYVLPVHPTFERLRKDPRYPAFCAKVGLQPG